jgi:acyl-CoA hydrolase
MCAACRFIAASRHCRAPAMGGSLSAPPGCVLATVSECTFERPMHIGDVSRCDAVVTFAAGAAVEVLVQVYREDLVTGESHRTNKSRLWYVQCKQVKVEVGDDDGEAGVAKEKSKARHVVHKFVPVSPVPDVVGLTEEERAAGTKRYADHRRSMRVDDPAETAVGADDDWKFEQLRLSQLMLPSDATASGIVFGGTLFSCAFQHCQS